AGQDISSHYAMIGMATVMNGYPLYYDAVNEKGLAIAGLNFEGNAHYFEKTEGKNNVASFEFIPYLLGTCEDVKEVKEKLANMNIVNIAFSEEMPPASLHWMISDKAESIVVESMQDGLHVYGNPVGVMTNNPPFNYMIFALNDYASLSPKQPANTFGTDLDLYSRGMGGLGLPGDLSSKSRFIKCTYTKLHSLCGDSETESVNQFFKILGSVEQQKGLCEVKPGAFEYTIYSSCCNMDKGIYYYTTYNNSRIHGIDMHDCDLDSAVVRNYPLVKEEPFIIDSRH
ncbi:MAG: choloylglycine hydrolase, partial [Eubacteriales bacterium]|nr:choloylglycine hydrolase [Eubacteriales bacterium]